MNVTKTDIDTAKRKTFTGNFVPDYQFEYKLLTIAEEYELEKRSEPSLWGFIRDWKFWLAFIKVVLQLIEDLINSRK
jgi:hypothetical protein